MLGFAGQGHRPAAHPRAVAPQRPGSSGGGPERGFWYRWSRTVQRQPVGVRDRRRWLVLVVLAIPLLSMRLAFSDAGNDPTIAHHPPGLRPALRRVRPRLQRAAGPRRRAAGGPEEPRRGQRARRPHLRRPRGGLGQAPAVFDAGGRRGGHRSSTRRRPRRPRRRRRWSTTCATRSIPEATAGTGVTVFVGGETAGGDRRVGISGGQAPVGDRRWSSRSAFILLMIAVFRSIARPDQGRRHERAVDRRRLRGHRGRLPVGVAVSGVRREPARGRSTPGSR